MLVFILVCIVCFMISSLLKSKESIFWVAGERFNLLFLFEGILILYFPSLMQLLRKKKYKTVNLKMQKIVKYLWGLFVCIISILIYIIVTDSTYITNEHIVHRSFLNPTGTIYTYQEVNKIETGFYGKKRFLGSSKGTFYYCITLKDGTRIDLNNQISVDTDKIEDYETYKEIENVDNKMMHLGIEKISSTESIEFNHLDERYKKRFLRIINNK